DFFHKNKITHCINCAAYTAVDKAESEGETAQKINVNGVSFLAEAAKKNDVTLIHISSDYVYHNEINRPLKEDDIATPKSIYAQTKLDGDVLALKNNKKTFVLRTSWVYSSFGNNFVKTMKRLGAERDALNIVYDQIGTPTYARDLAEVIFKIIEKENTLDNPYGVYHFSNEGVTSWYDFALEIFHLENIKCKVTPILSKDYPTPAARPTFSIMDKSKIKETFGFKIRHWKESLANCLEILKS
ncbi:MAG: dTDP-4-dehydrorhamnose reductase, partial [Saprospiraceae bacterium]